MSDTEITAIVPRSFDEVQALSKAFAVSALLPAAIRNKPGDVAIVIMTGAELGLGPMTSLRGLEVIGGKATLKPELMSALVKPSPECEYLMIVECTNDSCTLETKRRGTPAPERVTYTMEDAKRAGLAGKDNYNKNPSDMLFARCLSRICRRVYPDKTFNTYAPGEIEEVEPTPEDTKREQVQSVAAQIRAGAVEGVVVKSETVSTPNGVSATVQVPAAPSAEAVVASVQADMDQVFKAAKSGPQTWDQRIAAAATAEALRAFTAELVALPEPEKSRARELYKKRKAALGG